MAEDDERKIIRGRVGDDPGYAVAWAILELADATRGHARALDGLGLNETAADGAPGTTTVIAIELGRIAEALEQRRAEAADGHDHHPPERSS